MSEGLYDQSILTWDALYGTFRTTNFFIYSDMLWASDCRIPYDKLNRICQAYHGLYQSEVYNNFKIDPNNYSSILHSGFMFLGSNNYWHFLVDGIGSLFAYSGEETIFYYGSIDDEKVIFLLNLILMLGIKASLVNFHHRQVRLIKTTIPITSRFIYLKRLKFSRHILHILLNKIPSRRSISFNRAIRERFNQRVLFISREDAKSRRLKEEIEVFNVFRKYFANITYVRFSEHKVIDQLSMANNAEILVGVHGAGLTNALVAQTGALLIEFASVQMPNFFRILSQASGLSYIRIVCSKQDDHLVVDLNKLEGIIKSHIL